MGLWCSRQVPLQLVALFQCTTLEASKPFQKCFKHIPGRTKNDYDSYEKLYEAGAFGEGYINTTERMYLRITKKVKWIAFFFFLSFYDSYQQIKLFT